MKAKIEELRISFKASLAECKSGAELEEIRIAYLGKKGHIAELMKGLRDVADKKEAGQLINCFKRDVEDAINERQASLEAAKI